MSKRIADLKVIQNIKLNNDFFILELLGDQKLPEMKPGQFVQAKVEGSPQTFLRRPLSVHDVDYGANTFKLLIQLAGKGTEQLSGLKNGDYLNLVFPLGNSFTMPGTSDKVLLIGGGCGVAPLLFLAKALKKNGNTPDIILGFRNKARIIEYEQYLKIGKVFITTEDGSVGEKGYVTEHSVLKNNSYHKVYCCGPESMMHAVAQWSKTHNSDCEVSLENLMACGIGVCLCCVVDTVKGHLCTCTDGPVFNIKDLKW
ncbi:MAG TPA: dihydroorotate dehydrogenase electron transfer subunit [Bacteroidales bacterium]|nr:dihydroorotate dehydrogenase electron transfer subunit [Bacteroidales bacterium]